MTLALLLTAVTGAWASGEIVVTVTAADLQADLSNPFTKNGVTIKCSDRMTGGLAFNELNEMSTTLGYFTKIEITNQFPEGISGINGVNGFSVNGSVATWTGKASSVGLGNYSVGPVVQFVFTIEPAEAPVTVEWNASTKTGTFAMPGSDVVLTPQYAPAAKWDVVENVEQLPAALEGIIAGQDAAIVTAGQSAQGTVMYAVTTSAEAAPALTAFSSTVPTAKDYDDAATLYVWYYIQGADTPDGQEATEENTFNDSEICETPVTVKIHRDLFDRVSAVLNNGSRVRLIMNEGKYQPIETLTYTLTDISDAENPKTLVSGTDYTYGGLQRLEDGSYVDVTDESNLPPGTYRALFNGMGDFAGLKPTDAVFELYYGYEVYVPAHEYVTYCSTEALTLEDENAALYTITAVSNSEATLSRALTVAPATTPLLVENNSDESRTILLIPTDKQADAVTPAEEFIGVLDADRDLYKNDYFDYYAFNGLDFVRVVNTVTIPVGKCFIRIQTGNLSARSITIRRSATAIGATLVNSEEVNSEEWFDLNGRKVNKPTKKGIYIKNGKKVVIK